METSFSMGKSAQAMNDAPRSLRLRPEAPLACSQCGGCGLILIGPPALQVVRCVCTAGMRPLLWTGAIHPDDWAWMEARGWVETTAGKNVRRGLQSGKDKSIIGTGRDSAQTPSQTLTEMHHANGANG